MKTAICCIAKGENAYLEEWVDYHLGLGFSRIFIYDNNEIDGEKISELFIGRENVIIIDCRGKKAFQSDAYTLFYNTYGKQFDWIAYIDVDEFITFSVQSGIKSIDEFLCGFGKDIDAVHLNWMCYGDNGLTELDGFSVLKRFTNPLAFETRIMYDFPENNHVKSIIRGGLSIGNEKITPHTPKGLPLVVADAKGNRCKNDYFKPYDFSVAYIRHFVTKTIYEWLLKVSRGLATGSVKSELYPVERFFQYNERTPEKERVIKDYFFFKKCYISSVKTELNCLESDYQMLKNEFEVIQKKYASVLNSRAYKIGKRIVRCFPHAQGD